MTVWICFKLVRVIDQNKLNFHYILIRTVMMCPKCDAPQTSKNIHRHLKIHNMSKEEICDVVALMKARMNGNKEASAGREVKKCPFCNKVVRIRYTPYIYDN